VLVLIKIKMCAVCQEYLWREIKIIAPNIPIQFYDVKFAAI
jgi:hypothetical protein